MDADRERLTRQDVEVLLRQVTRRDVSPRFRGSITIEIEDGVIERVLHNQKIKYRDEMIGTTVSR